MEENYKEAFYEVNEIIEKAPDEISRMIPNSFKQLIKDNKSKSYNKEIDLNNLNSLKKETIVILGYIYRDFLCDDETKKKILKEEQQNLENLYSFDKLFDRNKKSPEFETNKLIPITKDKWHTSILNFIKKIFS